MILNLTQHAPSAEQVADGVVDLIPMDRKYLLELVNFSTVPTSKEVEDRVRSIVSLITLFGNDGEYIWNAKAVMLGGAPYLTSKLEAAFKKAGMKVLYSFTQRVSEEELSESGELVKVSKFKHVGWVKA